MKLSTTIFLILTIFATCALSVSSSLQHEYDEDYDEEIEDFEDYVEEIDEEHVYNEMTRKVEEARRAQEQKIEEERSAERAKIMKLEEEARLAEVQNEMKKKEADARRALSDYEARIVQVEELEGEVAFMKKGLQSAFYTRQRYLDVMSVVESGRNHYSETQVRQALRDHDRALEFIAKYEAAKEELNNLKKQ